jgi:hypothetical protein
MANLRISQLPVAPGAPNPTDVIEGERSPGGTPSSEKLTWNQAADGTAFSSRYATTGDLGTVSSAVATATAKLAGIEDGADVTDAVNVTAAGAFMASSAGGLAVKNNVTVLMEKDYTVPGVLAAATGSVPMRYGRTATITAVRATVYGSTPAGASIIVDVNKNGTTIFTTQANRPTITAGNSNATVGAIGVTSIAANDVLTIDIDQVGSTTPGSNLVVTIVTSETVS